MNILLDVTLPVLGYVFGSISSAIIVCKALSLPDPRTDGSGNPGATNVLRLGGKAAAATTLVADILKGVIPVVIAGLLTDKHLVIALTGLGAFLGHLYPVFFGFRGGKGVATAIGVLFGWGLLLGLAVVAVWLLFALASRYSSLGSLVSMGLAPVFASLLNPGWGYLVCALIMTALIYIRHRENIKRLRAGTESRIRLGSKR